MQAEPPRPHAARPLPLIWQVLAEKKEAEASKKAEARRKAKFERLETSKRNFFVRKRTKQQPIIDKAQTLVSPDALMRHYPSA